MTKPFCIYHGNCFDGFTAAWAVWKRFGGDFEYFAGHYGEAPPDVTDRHVFIVDFSYKRPVLEQLAANARSLIVLDHHKTAAEDLSGYLEPLPLIAEAYRDWWPEWRAGEDRRIQALFDMNRSGAGIAWDFFHPTAKRPDFLHCVEDRDLWRFAIPWTREVHAAMSAYPFTFEAWEEIAAADIGALTREGAAIDRKHLRDIATLIPLTMRRMTIGGFDVPVANLPVTMCSDAGNIMCKGEPFAATYYDTADSHCFSLRSTDAGEDVSAIAKLYGGGGHRNAAGFKIPRGTNP